MFIYGMVFFPLFVSLAIGSMLGYFVGALYVWMLTGVEIYRLTECQMTVVSNGIVSSFIVIIIIPVLIIIITIVMIIIIITIITS